jgi:hypothetical protein
MALWVARTPDKTNGVNSWLQNLLCEKLLIDTSLVFRGDL